LARGDFCAVPDCPADALQPGEGGLFNSRLSKGAHNCTIQNYDLHIAQKIRKQNKPAISRNKPTISRNKPALWSIAVSTVLHGHGPWDRPTHSTMHSVKAEVLIGKRLNKQCLYTQRVRKFSYGATGYVLKKLTPRSERGKLSYRPPGNA